MQTTSGALREWLGDRPSGTEVLFLAPNIGSADDVRREVEQLVHECGSNGGLVLMPSNVIQPDTPIENIIACYHTARDLAVRRL